MRTTTKDRRLERKLRASRNGAEETTEFSDLKNIMMTMVMRDIHRDLRREDPRQQERHQGTPWASRASLAITVLVALVAVAALWFSLTALDQVNYWFGG